MGVLPAALWAVRSAPRTAVSQMGQVLPPSNVGIKSMSRGTAFVRLRQASMADIIGSEYHIAQAHAKLRSWPPTAGRLVGGRSAAWFSFLGRRHHGPHCGSWQTVGCPLCPKIGHFLRICIQSI
jgi:hypothetical protein